MEPVDAHDIARLYQGMDTTDLLRIAAERGTLTDDAKLVLDAN